MEMAFREDGDVTIIDLSGGMKAGEDIVNFRYAVRKLSNEGRNSILVSMKKVGRLDSSGLGELIAGYASVDRNGGKLKLVGLSDSIVELMMMTKLLTVFEVFEDEAEAIRSFRVDGESQQKLSAAAAGRSGESTDTR